MVDVYGADLAKCSRFSVTGRAPNGARCYSFAIEPKVSTEGNAPSRGEGEGFSIPLTACRFTPKSGQGKATPCQTGYRRPAATSLFSVLAAGQQGALAARLFSIPAGSFSLPVFPTPPLFLQKSAPVLCSLLAVSIKDAALRVLCVFYKPSRAHSAHPRGRRLTGGSEGKTGRKRIFRGY